MPRVIEFEAANIDFQTRTAHSAVVAASPAAAAETTIASITIPGDIYVTTGVLLIGWAAFTVGTNGTAANLKIRRTDTSGSTVAATGATTGGIAAANLVDMNVMGMNASPAASQVYVLTLTVTAGSAASTVSAVSLFALAI